MLGESWERLDPAERDELLAGMQSSAAGLQRLLGDLLTTSRLHAATLDLDLVERDLAEALRPVIRRLRVAHPDAVIESELGAGVRAVVDADRLAQIVDNLVANAVAHGRSPIHVTIQLVGEEAELTVRDAGPGVPPDLRDRLFERFATRGGGGHGTGLGLHIVRELAQALGGEASYLPEENAFAIRLPRGPATP
jgi:signal transduction histidine kinase